MEKQSLQNERDLPPGTWAAPQGILVILAHPDDPEFFCGGTLARWAAAGHQIAYCLLTCGDKGTQDRSLGSEALCALRQKEQRAAAAVLGVQRVRFLNHPDGYLEPTLQLRKEVTRLIRQEKPDVLVTCDPTTLYVGGDRLNHPDHRAAGQVVLDAVFPAARDYLYFPELLNEEHLEPHAVREVWVSGTQAPDVVMDVTDTWQVKLRALYEHGSQIGDRQAFTERMMARHTPDSTLEKPRFEEKFRRIVFNL
ncbi:MAG: PIG-L family deacetylase [Anaerolineales bacterium]|nr:PIG-L family deacetylase [Anaerolineales bacterium]